MTLPEILLFSGFFLFLCAFCMWMVPETDTSIKIRDRVESQVPTQTHFLLSESESKSLSLRAVYYAGDCKRCNGSGLWRNLSNRTCFRCGGSGVDPS